MTITNFDAIRLIAVENAASAVQWAQFRGRPISDDLQHAIDWHTAATAALNAPANFQGVQAPKKFDKLHDIIEAEALQAVVSEKAVEIAREHVTQAGLHLVHATRRQAEEVWVPAARAEFQEAVERLLTVADSAPDHLEGTEDEAERDAFVTKNEALDTINGLSQERRAMALALDEGRDLPAQASIWLVAVPPTEDDLERVRERWGPQLGLARLGDLVGALSNPGFAQEQDMSARDLNLLTLAAMRLDLCEVGQLAHRYRQWQNIAPVRPSMTGQGWEQGVSDAISAYRAARPQIYRERAAELAGANA